jgi:toxin ParE1/3/4
VAYVVNVTARAERDLAVLFDEVDAERSEAALSWYRGLKEAILSLEEHPNRCPVTRENVNLRHLLFGHRPHIYRVIFRVQEKRKEVEIVHIRHSARRRFKASDVV